MIKQEYALLDGLSGLNDSCSLNGDKVPGVEVNLIAKKGTKNLDKRTTAISDTNYKFVNLKYN